MFHQSSKLVYKHKHKSKGNNNHLKSSNRRLSLDGKLVGCWMVELYLKQGLYVPPPSIISNLYKTAKICTIRILETDRS